ncbi:MAG: LL-diaminopimelate aminotransferase [Bacteroidaceae bacterium]|nr:LL-diaminopimelate aminotransferase [Bacteroidaceae bacterium]
MSFLNENFLLLAPNYLFADVAKKVSTYKAQHPDADIISLGIGDVTQPLCPAVIEAMHRATDEMASAQTFRGYGPENGYAFLREAIARDLSLSRGITIDADEIFVNDGAKPDTGNIQELIHHHSVVGVTDPVYPVYLDSNAMAGRTGADVVYLPCNADNGFVPQIPERHIDVIYLCYPNNPTGTVLTAQQLQQWVDYALDNDSIILYDAAYQAFITDPSIPHSIYEIEGARKCAIEFHSYSKTAGFTGVRCGYTIVPRELTAATHDGQRISLNHLWDRRQCTKFNGASYISQRAAEAVYTPEGKEQVQKTIDYYMRNAHHMLHTLRSLGHEVYGGQNAPYLWMRTPSGYDSWQFFDHLLREANVICTPGVGFGPSGEGYVRFTAFGSHENTAQALSRISLTANH